MTQYRFLFHLQKYAERTSPSLDLATLLSVLEARRKQILACTSQGTMTVNLTEHTPTMAPIEQSICSGNRGERASEQQGMESSMVDRPEKVARRNP